MSNGTASSPRSAKIREQLADLAKVKATAQAYGEREIASKIALQGILAHERELLEELHAAEMVEATEKSNGAVHVDRDQAKPLLQESEYPFSALLVYLRRKLGADGANVMGEIVRVIAERREIAKEGV